MKLFLILALLVFLYEIFKFKFDFTREGKIVLWYTWKKERKYIIFFNDCE